MSLKPCKLPNVRYQLRKKWRNLKFYKKTIALIREKFVLLISYLEYIPKHIPHSPVSMTSKITHTKSPLLVSSNTVKLKISTSVVWKHITRNCVTTCDVRISIAVTPDTRHRSRMPSLRSINMAPDVKATDKKKMILRNKSERKSFWTSKDFFFSCFFFDHE